MMMPQTSASTAAYRATARRHTRRLCTQRGRTSAMTSMCHMKLIKTALERRASAGTCQTPPSEKYHGSELPGRASRLVAGRSMTTLLRLHLFCVMSIADDPRVYRRVCKHKWHGAVVPELRCQQREDCSPSYADPVTMPSERQIRANYECDVEG